MPDISQIHARKKNDAIYVTGETDTFTKTAFSLIAVRFRTTNSRRTSNAVSTSASFPLQIWVTRAPTTSCMGNSQ